MGVRAVSPARHGVRSRRAIGLALAAILFLAASTAIPRLFDSSTTAPPPALSGELIAYLQFDSTADSLWLVDPARPAEKRRVATIAHAPDFGAVPSLAPDGRSFVYNVLPPGLQEPTADSPAQLWLQDVLAKTEPRLLADDVDLLVPAVWSPDRRGVVVRRSGDVYTLVAVAVDGSGERTLVESAEAALFPVGYAADGAFYYVELSLDGSHLGVVDTEGARRLLTLSEGLTRDWALSPDGKRLAYLELLQTGSAIASQAFVLDLAAQQFTTVSNPRLNAFAPTWDASGSLAYGSLAEGRGGSVLSDTANFAQPQHGFDVPLAFASDGRLAVRSFDGVSLQAPGNASLAVIDASGGRQTIANGEVTFLGWTRP